MYLVKMYNWDLNSKLNTIVQAAAVQYTFTHKQYTERHETNNTYNNTINNFGWKAFWDSNPEWSN